MTFNPTRADISNPPQIDSSGVNHGGIGTPPPTGQLPEFLAENRNTGRTQSATQTHLARQKVGKK